MLKGPKIDHWLLLANVLLPSRGCIPRQWQGEDEGHGHGRVQARGLPGCARQNEQPRGAQDRHQALRLPRALSVACRVAPHDAALFRVRTAQGDVGHGEVMSQCMSRTTTSHCISIYPCGEWHSQTRIPPPFHFANVCACLRLESGSDAANGSNTTNRVYAGGSL